MKKYLCIFTNYQQVDLLKKLAMVKFAANNKISASTKVFLFFITKNFHLEISFNIVELSNASTYKQIFK